MLSADLMSGTEMLMEPASSEVVLVASDTTTTTTSTTPTSPPPTGPQTTTPATTIPTTPIAPTPTTTPDPCQMSQQANAAEFAVLKQKIDDHIEEWARQQDNLITDSFSNGWAAVQNMIGFLNNNAENLKVFVGNSVNLTWAGSAVMYPVATAGPIGLGAVLLGIAANTAINHAQNSGQPLEDAIRDAIFAKRQEARDQVTAIKQEWDQKFAELLGKAEPCKDVSQLQSFYGEVQTALPVMPTQPQPPSVNSMYQQMLLDYASVRGWRTWIVGSQWHEDNFGTYWYVDSTVSGVFGATQWPFILDAQDLVNELNSLRP